MDLRERPDSRDILRGEPERVLQLLPGVVQTIEIEQGPSERHPGGYIGGVPREPGTADLDGLLASAEAPVFFRERGERNRRRVELHPASELLDAGHLCLDGPGVPVTHARQSTTRNRYDSGAATSTSLVTVAVRPASSLTVRVTE